jgi:excisionase family DNA binding protein
VTQVPSAWITGWRQVAEVVMKDRDLYSIEEARERLGGISRNTLYEMLRKGELASVILGCRRFIAADAIAKLIKSATTTSSPAMDSTRSRKAAQQFLSLPLPASAKSRRRASGI